MTVSATVVVWVAEAAVPVTVTVTGPPSAAPAVGQGERRAPPAVTGFALKAAVTPLGRPPRTG